MAKKEYSSETLDFICQELSTGKSLTKIIRENPELGHPLDVWNWKDKNPEVNIRISRARSVGEDVRAEGTIEVARGLEGSTGDVQRDKLILETELRLLKIFNPAKFGEKVQVEQNVVLTLPQLVEQSMKIANERVAQKILEGQAERESGKS